MTPARRIGNQSRQEFEARWHERIHYRSDDATGRRLVSIVAWEWSFMLWTRPILPWSRSNPRFAPNGKIRPATTRTIAMQNRATTAPLSPRCWTCHRDADTCLITIDVTETEGTPLAATTSIQPKRAGVRAEVKKWSPRQGATIAGSWAGQNSSLRMRSPRSKQNRRTRINSPARSRSCWCSDTFRFWYVPLRF